ncbi:hypothetical protein ACGFOW_24090 [Streptomyces rubiginosohelvolus]|uniref:hypothetical protein n=1 Tax=Streptomyces rubiginosohelvolus TaxID=67362 RepID=UPI0037128E07
MYEVVLAARTSHSVNYWELFGGALVAFLGLMLALNVRGCAETASDFLGDRVFSAFYHNDLILRAPAAIFALLGAILSLINLKILFFGF